MYLAEIQPTWKYAPVSTAVLWTFAGIMVLLLLASLVIRFLRPTPANEDGPDELALRIRTWWIIVLSLFATICTLNIAAIVLLATISFLALREYYALITLRTIDRPVQLLTYAAIPVQFGWAVIGWIGMSLVFIPVYMFIAVPCLMVVAGKTEKFVTAASTLQWGLMICVFNVSHAAMLLTIPLGANPHVQPHWWSGTPDTSPGASLLLFVLVLTQLNDVAQYCWGKTLGKRKVIPTVSPNKTVAGLVGGVATTVLVASCLGPWLTLLDLPVSILLGVLIGVAGFAGDICVSAIKRDLGVKDTGTLLPGHGGILDRMDSLTFTAPLFFHIVYFLYG